MVIECVCITIIKGICYIILPILQQDLIQIKNSLIIDITIYWFGDFYKSISTFLGGLPIIALSPFTTIGRSINFGYFTIAVIHSESFSVFPLYFSLKIFSFMKGIYLSSQGGTGRTASRIGIGRFEKKMRTNFFKTRFLFLKCITYFSFAKSDFYFLVLLFLWKDQIFVWKVFSS